MAYRPSGKQVKNEEHAFQTIQKQLKADALKGVLFFYGKEQYLIDWAVGAIVNRYVNPATAALEYSKLNGVDTTWAEIQNSCETLPMFSERRVVLVSDFPPISGGKSRNFSENDEKDLADYVKQLPETTLLIFTGESADKRKKLYKAIADQGGAYEFGPLTRALLTGTIEKRLAQAGKRARAQAISAFIDHTGYFDKDTDYTMFNVENDLKKAIAHAVGEEVNAEDFMGIVAGNIDTDVFAMMDFISRGNKPEAFVRLHNILDSGESVYKLLALICSQFEIMLSAKEMREEGQPVAVIQKTLGVHEFRLKKALQFAEPYSVERLRKILKSAYEVDKNIKTGLLDQTLALEMFVAEI